MKLLLDTHAFLWWLAGDDSLSVTAREAIADQGNAIFVSAASAWEITTKHRLRRLPGAAAIVADLEAAITDQSFAALPVTVRHGQTAGSLPGHHRDPFDRTRSASHARVIVGERRKPHYAAGFVMRVDRRTAPFSNCTFVGLEAFSHFSDLE